MRIVKEGWIFIIGTPALCVGAGALLAWAGWPLLAYPFYALGLVALGFMVYFFRDPERTAPADPDVVVSGADGEVRLIENIQDPKHLGEPVVRISVFLNPFNVHVNRTPVAGKVKHLAYVPGRHILTWKDEASEFNEHSEIRIEGGPVNCLVTQIVGPIVRRVIYWFKLDQTVGKGERLGLMKFGSRLDVYLPSAKVQVLVSKGDKVAAGLTPIAKIKRSP
jgi:phosphatidylserine decarboxylase